MYCPLNWPNQLDRKPTVNTYCAVSGIIPRLECNLPGKTSEIHALVLLEANPKLQTASWTGISNEQQTRNSCRNMAGYFLGIVKSDPRTYNDAFNIVGVSEVLFTVLRVPLTGLEWVWVAHSADLSLTCWRTAFLLQIPVFALILTQYNIRYVTPGKSKGTMEVLKRIDYLGSLMTLLVALGSPLFFLSARYNQSLPWSEARVITPLILAIVYFSSASSAWNYTLPKRLSWLPTESTSPRQRLKSPSNTSCIRVAESHGIPRFKKRRR
ncbi:hypothetical protein R3P38DRAFT_552615 [Favolaschia claudopus]|uniref:Uncharacterized protein n=1 Tax=Favolaschia claudopus TaxID=2862362 RepID=A0AAV9ZA78_9AGAR